MLLVLSPSVLRLKSRCGSATHNLPLPSPFIPDAFIRQHVIMSHTQPWSEKTDQKLVRADAQGPSALARAPSRRAIVEPAFTGKLL
ncbi:hypothetical protein NLG97_g1161 [Lecanicillium saksenae]|uniref:Uncharacterized protein n=1 Tax=Lecanicillium saksenae TaxID=468837 RepID=A0ACC1R771_9HYPO|nr:hypothetical protein NLG97_g1161 [Lecanicillium saksenae]